jgi:N-methylhydantoinase A
MILLGVDVGGTFTDLILADTEKGKLAIQKVASTSPNPSEGVLKGIRQLCEREGIALEKVDHLFHGTTVATNAMLEHKGARTGMITTKGYRDIVHIGRHQRPQNYSIMQDIPWQSHPLVLRRHRKVVSERLIPPAGEVLIPLDEQQVREQVGALRAENVESIAVCFLFSYLNAAHENRTKELVMEEFPGVYVTTSSDVSPQFREFERFTTTCMNAFLGPKVKRFVDGLSERLRDAGIRSDVHIMTSNGGVATAETISAKPVYSLLSGLAAGVLGGEWIGRQADRPNLITLDVGGTSADIGIVTTSGIAEAIARDTRIAGFPVMVPMIDVHTIGAGGGSIAYVDAGGAFRVGPKSAGAEPGPACYGRGGEEPTVTDANIVLGRLDPQHFLGGDMQIFPEKSHRAIEQLARDLAMDKYAVAEGINTILASNMANAIRSRTVQKGFDPRQFTLIAFGGAGPTTAVEVASHLKIPEILVPLYPGITSAFGLLTTDLKYDFFRTELLRSSDGTEKKLTRDIEELENTARRQLKRDGISGDKILFSRSLDLRYLGQGYELRVPLPPGLLQQDAWKSVWGDFHRRHHTEYGHSFPESCVEVVTLRVTGIGLMPRLPKTFVTKMKVRVEDAWLKSGETFFRVAGRFSKFRTEFFDRHRLPPGVTISGPAVFFQTDSTTVLPPGWQLQVDEFGNLVVTPEMRSQQLPYTAEGRAQSAVSSKSDL